MQDMKEILNSFDPITLGQMGNIRLMNRTDTKFVTNIDKLEQLLIMAKDDYQHLLHLAYHRPLVLCQEPSA
jgi:hypothetical protein